MFEGPLEAVLRTFLGVLAGITRALFWRLRLVWGRMSGRAQVVVSIALLLFVSIQTSSVAPAISATARGMALILVVAAATWMILMHLWHRRW